MATSVVKAVNKLLLWFVGLTTERTDVDRWRASLRVLKQQGDELKRLKLPVCGLEEEHWTSGTQQDAHEFLVQLLAYLQVRAFAQHCTRIAVLRHTLSAVAQDLNACMHDSLRYMLPVQLQWVEEPCFPHHR